ncbi:H/ACA ribonucleoprotein complex subunit GAR1 [Halolamina litorea]|uniref:H/ACA ribonucleoprotein complex subunit GAR1 n=1 Tax=Halolamina litorea TaxID=1515593 RepID=A0ABD6BUM4_9EURY|nr:Gar1/Naf1 family protein [Halolamina litorea]
MERVGTVSRTAQGLAIARCPGADHPPIGRAVVDENLDTVGRIVDVFGPVEQPYVAVTPNDRSKLTALVGGKLYAR